VAAGVSGVGPRILDLKVAPVLAVGTPTTASQSASPGTPGGGVATQTTSLSMTLVQQYAPGGPLSNAKGVTVDPKGNGFYLLTQDGQNRTTQFVTVNLPLQKTCLP